MGGPGLKKVSPRYPEDDEPVDEYSFTAFSDISDDFVSVHQPEISPCAPSPPQSPEYSPDNVRRSKTTRRSGEMFGVVVTSVVKNPFFCFVFFYCFFFFFLLCC